MKRVFLIFSALILTVCLFGCEQRKEPPPLITEGEFPFVFEYELDGQRYIIEDTVVCSYEGYAPNSFPYLTADSLSWDSHLKSGERDKCIIIEFEENTESVMVKGRINTKSVVVLSYGLGGYYMGDPDFSRFGPCITYIEEYDIIPKYLSCLGNKPLTNEQLEKYFGLKVIRLEFSDPIENTFIE